MQRILFFFCFCLFLAGCGGGNITPPPSYTGTRKATVALPGSKSGILNLTLRSTGAVTGSFLVTSRSAATRQAPVYDFAPGTYSLTGTASTKTGAFTAKGTIPGSGDFTVAGTFPTSGASGGDYALTAGGGTQASGSFENVVRSADKILFTSVRGENMEVFVMNSDGTDTVNLTNNPSNDTEPRFSPDRSKIAFVSGRDDNAEIYIMNADGTGQKRLTHTPSDGRDSRFTFDMSPVFSPDGSKILFISSRDENWEIYVMNADGSNQINLTQNATREDRDVRWSPDGSKILFFSQEIVGANHETDGLHLMNADGSDQKWLADMFAQPVGFSPDGSKILFSGYHSTGMEFVYDIFTINLDGSNKNQLTNTTIEEQAVNYSPDGTKILYQFNADVFVMNADGSNPRNLTNTDTSSEFTSIWSPDGRRIAFSSIPTQGNGNARIHVIDADGNNLVKLTDDTEGNTVRDWR